jgi:hypothetical protein
MKSGTITKEIMYLHFGKGANLNPIHLKKNLFSNNATEAEVDTSKPKELIVESADDVITLIINSEIKSLCTQCRNTGMFVESFNSHNRIT